MKQRWQVVYGEKRHRDRHGYAVTDGNVRVGFRSKSDAIAEAQQLNGWQVDGMERTYAAQSIQAVARSQTA